MDDADVGMLGEFGGECGGEVVIEFDGGKTGGAFGERAGEYAATGADFEDAVGGGEVGCGEDAGDDTAVNEEVLSEGFFGGGCSEAHEVELHKSNGFVRH